MSSVPPASETWETSVEEVLDPSAEQRNGFFAVFWSFDLSVFITVSWVGIVGVFPLELPAFIVFTGGLVGDFVTD